MNGKKCMGCGKPATVAIRQETFAHPLTTHWCEICAPDGWDLVRPRRRAAAARARAERGSSPYAP